MSYTILAHTADTGVEATARTFPGLVEELARGMFASMAAIEPCTPSRTERFTVVLSASDDAVYDVLSELLYRFEVEGIFFCSFTVTATDKLNIVASGIDAEEVELEGPPIKAVTLHQLDIHQQADGTWFGRVYFDV